SAAPSRSSPGSAPISPRRWPGRPRGRARPEPWSMNASLNTAATATDYKVADLKLADFGRKEIAIAETEMPGLMAIREEYARSQPLNGARISGSLHMTLDDGGDATLLLHLGARAESDPAGIAKPTSEEEVALFAAIRARLKSDPRWYSTRIRQVRGVTEETTTGVKRLYRMAKEGTL